MQRQFYRKRFRFLFVLCALADKNCRPPPSRRPLRKERAAPTPSCRLPPNGMKKVDQLVEQNEQLEKQNHDLVAEMK